MIRRLLACSFVFCMSYRAAQAQSPQSSSFQEVLAAIRSRPEYRHSFFGVEIYSLDTHKVLYAWNGERLFVPGSTTKLLTTGTAMHLLGADYRFHTPVYRTGEVNAKGELKGDLVLVASGDPTLSGRLQKDGTLAFSDEDHTYGGPDAKLVGDPMAALNEIAAQVATHGIHKVKGRVLIDASLFPEGEQELGTGITMSPVVVNDNVIDVVVAPGPSVGAPAALTCTPQVPYVHFVNQVKTSAAGTDYDLHRQVDTAADGTETVTVTGTIAIGARSFIDPYPVPSPTRFATALLIEALEHKGVVVENKDSVPAPAAEKWKSFYVPQNLVAEYVSAPFSEEVKVILKVSQNLHASNMPLLIGAVVGKDSKNPYKKGFELEHQFLSAAGLDLSGAAQSDGAGGAAFFTPDFMVHYLAYMASQPEFPAFEHALPILGKDGTLFNVETDSPAAGHVFAKTGTFVSEDELNQRLMLVGKGLAGYTTTPSGEHVAFAVYVNHVPLSKERDAVTKYAGQALGEISAAINLLPVAPEQTSGQQ